jgi:hypothetical protein
MVGRRDGVFDLQAIYAADVGGQRCGGGLWPFRLVVVVTDDILKKLLSVVIEVLIIRKHSADNQLQALPKFFHDLSTVLGHPRHLQLQLPIDSNASLFLSPL